MVLAFKSMRNPQFYARATNAIVLTYCSLPFNNRERNSEEERVSGSLRLAKCDFWSQRLLDPVDQNA